MGAAGGVELGPGATEEREIADSGVEARGHTGLCLCCVRIYAHGRGVAGVAPEGAGPRRFWLPTFEASAFVLLGRRPTPGLGRSAALGRSLFR